MTGKSPDVNDGLVYTSFSPAPREYAGPTCLIILAVLAFVAIIGAAAIPYALNTSDDQVIEDSIVVDSPGAEGFDQFQDWSTNADQILKYYFFNITNPSAVLDGKKPELKEIGPFVYRNERIRSDFEWKEVNNISNRAAAQTLSYREHKYFLFDPEATFKETGEYHSDKDVQLTTLNLMMLSTEAALGRRVWRAAYSQKETMDKLFVTVSPREILVGYGSGTFVFPGLANNASTPSNDPDYVYPSTILTGKGNTAQIGQYVSWRDMTNVSITCPWGQDPVDPWCPGQWPCCGSKTPVWKSDSFDIDSPAIAPPPNAVYGTVGDKFGPNLEQGGDVWVWMGTMWRSMLFSNSNNQESKLYDLTLQDYRIPRFWVANSLAYPPNLNFYIFGPDGLQNQSLLERGAPIFISPPHFLDCGNQARDGVTGLTPNADIHETVMSVDPLFGVTMRVHNRVQISARIERQRFNFSDLLIPSEWFPGIADDTYVPILWYDQSGVATRASADSVHALHRLRAVRTSIPIIGAILALFFCVAGFILWRCMSTRRAARHVQAAGGII